MRKLYLIFRDFLKEMKKQDIGAYASSSAFFIFLSLVPMLMLVCTIIPYTPVTQENFTEAVMNVTPNMADELAITLIDDVYQRSAGVLSAALIVTLWSAGKGVLSIIRGLNAIHDVEEHRNYFVLRIVSMFYTLCFLVAIVVALVIMVFGQLILEFFLGHLPGMQTILSFLLPLRYIVFWVLMTLFFSALYSYIPNKKLPFKEQIPGACITSVAWSVFSFAFSVYLELSSAYSVYGSMAILIIMMVWLYFCMYIVFVGAFLNRYFQPINKALVER